MDHLNSLLTHYSISAGVFYAGNICGVHDFHQDSIQSHIHLIRSGVVNVRGLKSETLLIDRPTLIFLPRPMKHKLVADDASGADVLCGTVLFGGGGKNPIADSLPDLVAIDLEEMAGMDAILALMFDEAFSDQHGRQTVLNSLCEVLMIRLLRHCIKTGLTQGGLLAGLADSRLSKVLKAMHDDPSRQFDLEQMAEMANMSRARFAAKFKEVIGDTPADYLVSSRLILAKQLLSQRMPVKIVAGKVGYGSVRAFTRAFIRKLKCSPTEWIKNASPG